MAHDPRTDLSRITVTVLAANFFMDVIYGFIDPRARHNG